MMVPAGAAGAGASHSMPRAWWRRRSVRTAERIFSPRIDSLVVESASEAFWETPFGAPPRDIAAVGGSVYRCGGIARMGVSCPWTLAGYSAVWWGGSFGYSRSQVRILLPRPAK